MLCCPTLGRVFQANQIHLIKGPVIISLQEGGKKVEGEGVMKKLEIDRVAVTAFLGDQAGGGAGFFFKQTL